jgi:hypothetical protein
MLRNEKPGVRIRSAIERWREIGAAEDANKGLTAFWTDKTAAKQYCTQNLEQQKSRIMRMNTTEEEEL